MRPRHDWNSLPGHSRSRPNGTTIKFRRGRVVHESPGGGPLIPGGCNIRRCTGINALIYVGNVAMVAKPSRPVTTQTFPRRCLLNQAEKNKILVLQNRALHFFSFPIPQASIHMKKKGNCNNEAKITAVILTHFSRPLANKCFLVSTPESRQYFIFM